MTDLQRSERPCLDYTTHMAHMYACCHRAHFVSDAASICNETTSSIARVSLRHLSLNIVLLPKCLYKFRRKP